MEETTPNGVLIAIDWENIRRGAQLYRKSVNPDALCRAMTNVGKVFGEVQGGKVFGDWSLRPDDGVAFNAAGIQPYQAPRTLAGKDRSDPAMLLEVYDWLRDRDDCRVIVLGTGDSDFQILVDRARALGRRIVLCAFSQSVARDMLAVTPLFPLEAELEGFNLPEHGNVSIEKQTAQKMDDALQTFIRNMDKIEGNLSFVGYSKLCTEWMLDWGITTTDYLCYQLVDQWVGDGVAERHSVYNANNPQFPTAAIRLNRTNEQVRELLGLNRPILSNPVISSQQAEAYSASE